MLKKLCSAHKKKHLYCKSIANYNFYTLSQLSAHSLILSQLFNHFLILSQILIHFLILSQLLTHSLTLVQLLNHLYFHTLSKLVRGSILNIIEKNQFCKELSIKSSALRSVNSFDSFDKEPKLSWKWTSENFKNSGTFPFRTSLLTGVPFW